MDLFFYQPVDQTDLSKGYDVRLSDGSRLGHTPDAYCPRGGVYTLGYTGEKGDVPVLYCEHPGCDVQLLTEAGEATLLKELAQ